MATYLELFVNKYYEENKREFVRPHYENAIINLSNILRFMIEKELPDNHDIAALAPTMKLFGVDTGEQYTKELQTYLEKLALKHENAKMLSHEANMKGSILHLRAVGQAGTNELAIMLPHFIRTLYDGGTPSIALARMAIQMGI